MRGNTPPVHSPSLPPALSLLQLVIIERNRFLLGRRSLRRSNLLSLPRHDLRDRGPLQRGVRRSQHRRPARRRYHRRVWNPPPRPEPDPAWPGRRTGNTRQNAVKAAPFLTKTTPCLHKEIDLPERGNHCEDGPGLGALAEAHHDPIDVPPRHELTGLRQQQA